MAIVNPSQAPTQGPTDAGLTTRVLSSEWQPISAECKDGRHVLLWCDVEEVFCSAYWESDPRVENGGAWYGTDPMHRLNWIQFPSLWASVNPPTNKGAA